MLWLLLLLLLSPAFNSIDITDHRRLDDLLSKFDYIDPPPVSVTIQEETSNMKLIVVYFAFIHPLREHYLELMRQQLGSFHCNGIFERATAIHLQLAIDTATHGMDLSRQILNETIDMVHSEMEMSKTRIEVTLENQFEYPGIRQLWDIGQSIRSKADADNTIVIYYHSKGMFYSQGLMRGPRLHIDVLYHHLTFDRWNEVLHLFHRHAALNKVGCAPAKKGWIWMNFFYVRASYLQQLQIPRITSDRMYYERWLGILARNESEAASASSALWPLGVQRIHSFNETLLRNDLEKTFHSFCDDCWSTCISKGDELGAYSDVFVDGLPLGKGQSFFRCRKPMLGGVDY